MSVNHGAVWWTELMTRDLEAAKKYYGEVCGWSFETAPMTDGYGDYVMGKHGDKMIVGMMDMSGMAPMKGEPAHWLSYFAVDDIGAAVASTRAAGGVVVREPFEVPNVGQIALIQDPGGAALGVIQPKDGG